MKTQVIQLNTKKIRQQRVLSQFDNHPMKLLILFNTSYSRNDKELIPFSKRSYAPRQPRKYKDNTFE